MTTQQDTNKKTYTPNKDNTTAGTSEVEGQLNRDEKIDFSKLEPLNPDGYM